MYYIILFINLYMCIPSESSIIPSGPKEELIIKGKDASEGQFPYAVALYRKGDFICTASIISKKYVLTAAHCVDIDDELQKASDYYGVANFNREASNYRMKFTKIVPHPDYDLDTISNDIAIMETTKDIPFGRNVNRICIANSSYSARDGARALVLGWGITKDRSNTIPKILQFAEHKIVSNDECTEEHEIPFIDDNKMCATDSTAGTCSGDSGGPLVSGDKKVQMGITSYGPRPCATTPAVFTRMSAYRSFMDSNVDPGSLCYK